MLTNKGRQLFAKLMAGNLPTGPAYCELGTDDTPPDRTDEQLYAGYYRKLALITYRSNILTVECNFTGSEGTPTPPDEIAEVGLFWDDATGTIGSGEMFARMLVFPTRPKPAGQPFTVKWEAYVGQCEFLEEVIPPTPPSGGSRIGEARIGEGEIGT